MREIIVTSFMKINADIEKKITSSVLMNFLTQICLQIDLININS